MSVVVFLVMVKENKRREIQKYTPRQADGGGRETEERRDEAERQ